MVSGGTFPGGDPFLQKQNEASTAMSTRNPCHLLAGANDYRAVNLPGLPDDQEIGDAWLGWYESTDCGATWYSTLVPGYPQDSSPEGMSSPVKGLSAGADPVVRSGAAGTFYYLFIAFNRGTNVGKLAVARAIDHNDRDAFVDPNRLDIAPTTTVNPRRALSPIQYVGYDGSRSRQLGQVHRQTEPDGVSSHDRYLRDGRRNGAGHERLRRVD